MLGSAFSIAGPNIVLNTVVAESLRQFADILENTDDFKGALGDLIRETIAAHKRIIFNGNNYSDEWVQEAERRGLSNLKTTVDALPALVSRKNMDVFIRHHVFSESEIHSRYEILLENYCKTLHIEALTMVDLVNREIIPACIAYQNKLAGLLATTKACGAYDTALEEQRLERLSGLSACLLRRLTALESALLETKKSEDQLSLARFYRSEIFSRMSELRLVVDELETLVAKEDWPLPTYGEMLYSVN